jgi:hypothetical protein
MRPRADGGADARSVARQRGACRGASEADGAGAATVTRMGRLWPARTRKRPRKASTVVRRARRPAPIRFAMPRHAPRVRALPAAATGAGAGAATQCCGARALPGPRRPTCRRQAHLNPPRGDVLRPHHRGARFFATRWHSSWPTPADQIRSAIARPGAFEPGCASSGSPPSDHL